MALGSQTIQFANRAGRYVVDAKLIILDKAIAHRDKTIAHINIIFADFSSAFNLMQPHLLAYEFISDFVVVLPSVCFVNRKRSDMRLYDTGSPQRYGFSPHLYNFYTDCCRSVHAGRFLV